MYQILQCSHAELVWKVARSTCAGPMLFSEFNNYVDGGVLCNNPTEKGVTAIQNYHSEKGERLPISLVVSVGSGMYPEEKLGNVDAQDCISLTKMSALKDRVGNLMGLFMNAVSLPNTYAHKLLKCPKLATYKLYKCSLRMDFISSFLIFPCTACGI